MLTSVGPQERAGRCVLDAADRSTVEAVADALLAQADGRVDDPDFVGAARQGGGALPHRLRRSLAEFRRYSGETGTLVLRGLPVGEGTMPDTPSVAGSVQRTATVAAGVLMTVATELGDPIAYHAEKSGALVQDVVPVPGRENTQENTGSVLLQFHNENAFHDYRPDYVMLLCLRPDHDREAGLRTACVRQVLPLLDSATRTALAAPEFVTSAPPSFCVGSQTEPHPVLPGALDDPDLRVDFAATTALTGRGRRALDRLQHLFGELAQTVYLEPGDLAIVDNRVTVHGRTPFRPRYDGEDRWLQRTFVTTDLRRSRALRPGDGYVLVG
ncbi:TauD/TfdA family dioxygenase [Plantactinospora endophytica]|uniref:L-asparagine oxygenase n=1 Tax=Plantactinospora endophytica TaxID=673535 RepID=A0ABQ4EC39_9ACTN|nr:TauD/TfdA family dioxygenase [Plantactinospora endophytica]GIG92298.1 L-asparagine oxygenase [Plantactinospora endophytica]